MSIRIDYETQPPIDGTVADIYNNDLYIGTMIYSEDLDQWNDCEFPGDVAARAAEKCVEEMVQFRINKR